MARHVGRRGNTTSRVRAGGRDSAPGGLDRHRAHRRVPRDLRRRNRPPRRGPGGASLPVDQGDMGNGDRARTGPPARHHRRVRGNADQRQTPTESTAGTHRLPWTAPQGCAGAVGDRLRARRLRPPGHRGGMGGHHWAAVADVGRRGADRLQPQPRACLSGHRVTGAGTDHRDRHPRVPCRHRCASGSVRVAGGRVHR